MFTNGLVHHFYIIEGEPEHAYGQLKDHLESKEKIVLSGNPDLYEREYQSINVDEARELKDFFSTRGFSEAKRIAIIRTASITREAQNALLKLTEEPTPHAHIFFIIPHTGLLIPTLLSRAEIISNKNVSSSTEGKSFIKKSILERLTYVQKIITKKDKEQAIALLDSLIAYARDEERIDIRKDLYTTRSYIEDKSSSIKLLLEHISLILPS